jgi:chromosome segregation ATPase
MIGGDQINLVEGKQMTEDLNTGRSDLNTNASESSLISSLQAARQSMGALDNANKDLIEALEGSQREIDRLASAGKQLQGKFRNLLGKKNSLELSYQELELRCSEQSVLIASLEQVNFFVVFSA